MDETIHSHRIILCRKVRRRRGLYSVLSGVILFLWLLCLSGCARQNGQKEERYLSNLKEKRNIYQVYFLREDLNSAGGQDALATENIFLPEGLPPQETAEYLLNTLLAPPTSNTLKSAIPSGTSLQSVSITNGQAQVDFSTSYSALSGVSLTLADYAVTLTLTQLPEVTTVMITVQGQELDYREQQYFSARDVLFSSQDAVVGHLQTRLYFADPEGNLSPETRTLDLYEGDTQVTAIAHALLRGPERSDLTAVFPENFQLQSLWVEDAICYVNLSSDIPGLMTDDGVSLSLALQSLSHSLCVLETVDAVRFLVDGEFAETYGSAPIAGIYS